MLGMCRGSLDTCCTVNRTKPWLLGITRKFMGWGGGGELCLFSLTWPWFYWSLKCVFYVHMWHLPSGKVLVVSEVASMDTDAFSSLASTDIWGVSGWVRVSLEGTQSSPDPWPWDLNQTWAPGLSSIADAQFWKYRKTKPGCVEQSHLSWRMIASFLPGPFYLPHLSDSSRQIMGYLVVLQPVIVLANNDFRDLNYNFKLFLEFVFNISIKMSPW